MVAKHVVLRWWEWLLRTRAVTVAGALLLVLVPTLFSVFPEWAEWNVLLRAGITLLWLGVAAIVASGAARQSERVEALVRDPLRRQEKARELAAARLIRAVLTPPHTGFPPHFEFRVFLYDEGEDRLLPSFEPDAIENSVGWEIGQGATGQAWASSSRIVAHGAKVSDATFGLSPGQQERYRELQVVAAEPIFGPFGRLLGVLTASSRVDDAFVDTPEGIDAHKELAAVVGQALLDFLGGPRDPVRDEA